MKELSELSTVEEMLALFEDWFADRTLTALLEWGGEEPILLSSCRGTFDYCDIGEHGEGNLRTFDFFLMQGGQEPHQISIPIDEDDLEINLEEDAVEIQCGEFFLRLIRVNPE